MTNNMTSLLKLSMDVHVFYIVAMLAASLGGRGAYVATLTRVSCLVDMFYGLIETFVNIITREVGMKFNVC